MQKSEKLKIKAKSELTDLLKEELEGNSKLTFFCNTPANCSLEFMEQSLEFAKSAKQVS